MNLLSSLNISSGALSVNEKAISVVSHNVSNMNTEGYHKQRVNLEARNIAGQIGDNPLWRGRGIVGRFSREIVSRYSGSASEDSSGLSADEGAGETFIMQYSPT